MHSLMRKCLLDDLQVREKQQDWRETVLGNEQGHGEMEEDTGSK